MSDELPALPSAEILSWVALGLLALAVLQVVLSALLERSGPIRLRHFAEEAGGRLRTLYSSRARFDAFRYLMSFLAKALPGALAVTVMLLFLALGAPPVRSALLALAVVGLLALLVEFINRIVVGRDPEAALSRFTQLYRAALLLLAPVVTLVAWFLPAFTEAKEEGESEEEEASEGEIDAFIDVGEEEGILEGEQGELVRGVVDFGDTEVRSVMTPRVDIVAAPANASLPELVPVFVESKCSRIPLYRESVDQVVGILHVRDLLRGLQAEPPPRAVDLARPPYLVPVTKPLDELMRELQARYQQMAIVVDEYGGTAGLVTVEDLIEEIFGELADEHEEMEPAPQSLGADSWRLEGRTRLEELAELAGLKIEEAAYETVGGLILDALGDVPEPGAEVERHGLRFTVEQVDERRIESVKVDRLEPREESSEAEEEAGHG